MSKRILAVGNGDELLEQVNGRIFRHVWDERSARYIAIQEDGASAYAARLRKVGIRVTDPARFEQAAAQLDNHYEIMAHPANGTPEEELAQYRIAHNLRREIARRGRGRTSGTVTHQPRKYKAGEAF